MIILFTILSIIVVVELIRLFLFLQKNNIVSQALLKRQKELSYINFLIGSDLLDKNSIDIAFPKFLDILKETVGWTYHSIYRLDESNQILIIRFTGYLPDWYMEEMSTKALIKVGDVSLGRSVATKQVVTANSVPTDPRFKDTSSLIKDAGIQAVTCCPIIGKLKTYAGFCTYSSRANVFTLHDAQFLLTCANIYSIFLENKLIKNYLSSSEKG